MGQLVSREIRRLELRAACFRVLARRSQGVVQRARLVQWAEAEERNIAELQSQSDYTV